MTYFSKDEKAKKWDKIRKNIYKYSLTHLYFS